MSKTHTFAIADEENCRLGIGESRLFANCGLKKQGKKKKEKKRERERKRRQRERKQAEAEKEREEGRGKKSLPQDSRDVVGIISTFAWMRVLYCRRVQPLPFPILSSSRIPFSAV